MNGCYRLESETYITVINNLIKFIYAFYGIDKLNKTLIQNIIKSKAGRGRQLI